MTDEEAVVAQGMRAMEDAVDAIAAGELTLRDAVELMVHRRADFDTWKPSDQECLRAYFAMFLRMGVTRLSRETAAKLPAAEPEEIAIRHGFDKLCAEVMGKPKDPFAEN
jgi:hypothetical protein